MWCLDKCEEFGLTQGDVTNVRGQDTGLGVGTNIRGWDVLNGQYLITSEQSEALEKMGADAPRSSSNVIMAEGQQSIIYLGFNW